jgi:hypothetical protein
MLPLRLLGFAALLSAASLSLVAAVAPEPRVFVLDSSRLEAARDGREVAARATLLAAADALLPVPPRSVMEKGRAPASGDKHDYFSMGPYWWPDPSKPDGLPYIRRDGELNPESRRDTDSGNFSRTCQGIQVLAAAFFVSGDARYGAKAAQLARVWFLDPATRMNPNFQHAQAIPGITTGRGIGIIEAQWLIRANEGLALLDACQDWTAADRAAMRAWNEQFYVWMTTAKNALEEKAWHNNHGTWYDAQVAHLALVIDRRDDAKQLLTEGLARIATQIEPDGRQPHELERTKSFNYSIYNLDGHVLCARLGEFVGVDRWNYATPDGRSVGGALRFIAPYADPEKPWFKADLGRQDRERVAPLLRAYLRRVDDPVLRASLALAEARDAENVRSLVDH